MRNPSKGEVIISLVLNGSFVFSSKRCSTRSYESNPNPNSVVRALKYSKMFAKVIPQCCIAHSVQSIKSRNRTTTRAHSENMRVFWFSFFVPFFNQWTKNKGTIVLSP